MLGVIEAGAVKALSLSKTRRIGIIATRSTINSGSYEKEIFKKDKAVKVFSQSCPLFVPMAEEGMTKGSLVDDIVQMYLAGFKKKNIDTLILGCTHYPLLKERIGAYLKGVHIIDSAEEVAMYTRIVLMERGLLNNSSVSPKKDFYVTDEAAGFCHTAGLFLKRKIGNPKVINI
jgi:glutamate racemase